MGKYTSGLNYYQKTALRNIIVALLAVAMPISLRVQLMARTRLMLGVTGPISLWLSNLLNTFID
jgi:hypothetical protein